MQQSQFKYEHEHWTTMGREYLESWASQLFTSQKPKRAVTTVLFFLQLWRLKRLFDN